MEILNKLRDKVNSSNFIYLNYMNNNEKNKWNCICSAMDWIQVGVATIREEDIYSGNHLIKCMNFYRYISAIDLVCEAIYQLHRIIMGNGELPFKGDCSVFKENVLKTQDDDEFFKEIRASFGAHATNLKNGKNPEKRRFASWSIEGGLIGENCDWSVILYSNQKGEKDICVGVNISDLKLYFEKRYDYIKKLIEKLDDLECEFTNKMKNKKIKNVSIPRKQLLVLEKENKERMCSSMVNELIKEIMLFFNTKFNEIANEKQIQNFKERLVCGIEEIKNVLQNMDYNAEFKILDILHPKCPRSIHAYNYELSNLYSSVFTNNKKVYFKEILIEPLKSYITFNYKTEAEFYFLLIIALNIAEENSDIIII